MDKVTKSPRSMERQMLHVQLKKIGNKRKDVGKEMAKIKWKFVGYNISQKNWIPSENKRSRERPQKDGRMT